MAHAREERRLTFWCATSAGSCPGVIAPREAEGLCPGVRGLIARFSCAGGRVARSFLRSRRWRQVN
jgi:hypothetical protein